MATWIKYRCDKGAQWTSWKESQIPKDHIEGSPCDFSGCEPGHKVHIVGETTDRDEAASWFNNPYVF